MSIFYNPFKEEDMEIDELGNDLGIQTEEEIDIKELIYQNKELLKSLDRVVSLMEIKELHDAETRKKDVSFQKKLLEQLGRK